MPRCNLNVVQMNVFCLKYPKKDNKRLVCKNRKKLFVQLYDKPKAFSILKCPKCYIIPVQCIVHCIGPAAKVHRIFVYIFSGCNIG